MQNVACGKWKEGSLSSKESLSEGRRRVLAGGCLLDDTQVPDSDQHLLVAGGFPISVKGKEFAMVCKTLKDRPHPLTVS